jgi:hypothetical protein
MLSHCIIDTKTCALSGWVLLGLHFYKVIELKLISEKEKCFRESQSIKHPQPISYKE